jgi:hypothetical protein
MYLWPAVDQRAKSSLPVQRRRDAWGRLVTDKLRSYVLALRRLRLACPHEQGLRTNNRAENSYQAVRRRERKNAAAQIGSIRPALSQYARCRRQQFQPSTPSRPAIDAAHLPSRGGKRNGATRSRQRDHAS